MTKSDLIDEVQKAHKESNLTKSTISGIVDSVFETMSKSIKVDKKFAYPDFGTFTIKDRKERQGRNPQTGEAITIAASKVVGFKPAPKLKSSL